MFFSSNFLILDLQSSMPASDSEITKKESNAETGSTPEVAEVTAQSNGNEENSSRIEVVARCLARKVAFLFDLGLEIDFFGFGEWERFWCINILAEKRIQKDLNKFRKE